MNTLIQMLKSRTVIFALVLALLSVLQAYVFLLPITPINQMFVGLAISVVVTILRLVTTTPVSAK